MNEPRPTQKDRILTQLQHHAATGVTNVNLNGICFRYAARINDLRNEGHLILSKKGKGSIWIFYYLGRAA